MMTTKAIFASFHSVLMDCCCSSVDFLTWEPSFSTSLPGKEGLIRKKNSLCFLVLLNSFFCYRSQHYDLSFYRCYSEQKREPKQSHR